MSSFLHVTILFISASSIPKCFSVSSFSSSLSNRHLFRDILLFYRIHFHLLSLIPLFHQKIRTFFLADILVLYSLVFFSSVHFFSSRFCRAFKLHCLLLVKLFFFFSLSFQLGSFFSLINNMHFIHAKFSFPFKGYWISDSFSPFLPFTFQPFALLLFCQRFRFLFVFTFLSSSSNHQYSFYYCIIIICLKIFIAVLLISIVTIAL